jgi:uncharacterized protein YjbJ (UPF0337 family)
VRRCTLSSFLRQPQKGQTGVRYGLESNRKGRAKEKWGRLTDDDLDVINGRQEQLEGKIQERYGLAKDQAKKDVHAWSNSLTNIM